MSRLIKILRSYKITEVKQIHEIVFWITLISAGFVMYIIIEKC